MSDTHFRTGARALILGASGGIGSALADAAEQSGQFAQVLRSGRKSGDVAIDFARPETIAPGIANAASGEPLDCIIIASGILHTEHILPEKTVRNLNAAAMTQVLAINTVGPALVIAAAMSHLPKGNKAVVAALSARVGSISDNRLGGWVSYRASKAALNQVIRTTSVEWARSNKQAIVLGLHPGTVDTALSEPFQRNLTPGKLFTPTQSADQLWQVIARATPSMSGRVYDFAGEEVPA
jgi:NAD(P)-dependent dehydrogenase (short-subunit alcohol dehydrogenase family)